MLIWILNQFQSVSEQVQTHAAGDSRVYLTARTALAGVVAFVLAVLLGPMIISWLKSRYTERIASDSRRLNELHAAKQQTPTMGGLLIGFALLGATLICGDLTNPLVLLGIAVVVGFATLGFTDDWTKFSTRRNGLRARTKFGIQAVIAFLITAGLYFTASTPTLYWPLGGSILSLGLWYLPWGMLVIVGTSNGVNLTDGLDGLAGGCLVFVGSAFVALSYIAGHSVMAHYLAIPFVSGSGELAVMLGAMVGAMLGFLWFNCYPAQVFMGDTGSLPLGALLGFAALAIKQEIMLVIVGGIFVIETLSVILQVASFKLTGKRIIACSPLHNHFVFQGMDEHKIVVRFWIGSALCALVGIASLKIQ